MFLKQVQLSQLTEQAAWYTEQVALVIIKVRMSRITYKLDIFISNNPQSQSWHQNQEINKQKYDWHYNQKEHKGGNPDAKEDISSLSPFILDPLILWIRFGLGNGIVHHAFL